MLVRCVKPDNRSRQQNDYGREMCWPESEKVKFKGINPNFCNSTIIGKKMLCVLNKCLKEKNSIRRLLGKQMWSYQEDVGKDR